MAEPATSIAANPATILIVEDEALLREIAAIEFEDAGYTVLQAADGDTALAFLASDAPVDLLFTDVSLRNSIDGWEIAARARSLRPNLPVIYTTGYAADTPQLVDGGRLVRKPYLPTDVIAAVRTMVG